MSAPTFTISALQPEDVPAAAQISADAFVSDRHTEMKAQGTAEPYDLCKINMVNIPASLRNERCVVRKAVDNATGELMGFCTWAFTGFDLDEVPHIEGEPQYDDIKPPASTEQAKKAEEKALTPEEAEAAETDPVKKLIAFEGTHMQWWRREVSPPGTKCLIVAGLIVAPKFQGRGLGKAFLQYGIDFCDEKGVFAWVPSSEAAYPVYKKVGFEVVRELDLDLDKYSPGPPLHEGPDAKWGHYITRYMKYFPKNKKQV